MVKAEANGRSAATIMAVSFILVYHDGVWRVALFLRSSLKNNFRDGHAYHSGLFTQRQRGTIHTWYNLP